MESDTVFGVKNGDFFDSGYIIEELSFFSFGIIYLDPKAYKSSLLNIYGTYLPITIKQSYAALA